MISNVHPKMVKKNIYGTLLFCTMPTKEFLIPNGKTIKITTDNDEIKVI